MTKPVALRFALVAGTALAIAASLGTAEARDIKVQRKVVAPVVVETVAPAVLAAEETRAPVAASTVVAVASSPCGRKVKVVYAGYGEAERAKASCETPVASLSAR